MHDSGRCEAAVVAQVVAEEVGGKENPGNGGVEVKSKEAVKRRDRGRNGGKSSTVKRPRLGQEGEGERGEKYQKKEEKGNEVATVANLSRTSTSLYLRPQCPKDDESLTNRKNSAR